MMVYREIKELKELKELRQHISSNAIVLTPLTIKKISLKKSP